MWIETKFGVCAACVTEVAAAAVFADVDGE